MGSPTVVPALFTSMIARDTNTTITSIPIIQLMNNGVSQDLLNTILGDVLSLCRQSFETRLVSVVLFGSYAQGTASPGSDIDLLVIVHQLPADPEPQEKLLDSIEIPILKKYHRCVSVILATPEAVQNEVNRENPLFFGIWTGYSILLDSKDFFRNCMEIVRHHIQRSKPVFIDGRRRWNLAEI